MKQTKNSLGIVGNGFVGNAIYQGLKEHHKVLIYDTDPNKSQNSVEEISAADYIFLCVPTPTTAAGRLDISIVTTAISNLPGEGPIIIKSTMTPTAAESIIKTFPDKEFVFNPEFLSERTAVEDFRNPSRIVLGGAPTTVEKVKEMYMKVFPSVKYITTDHITACFIKYYSNCFSAAKISVINEFKQIADSHGVDWEAALDGFLSSGWVNPMHTMVPGHDGHKGFGGKCFPKDLVAFINYSENMGIDPAMLKAAWNKNLIVREEYDWLRINGAISKGEIE